MAITKRDPFDVQHPFPQDLRLQRDTVADRDTIPEFIRWEGMTVYVIQEQKTFQLVGGINNSNWVEVPTGNTPSGTFVPMSWVDTDGTLSANSDQKIATQKAVKTYVDGAAKDAKTTLEVTGPLTINWDGTVPSGGKTFRQKHGEDFLFQGYYDDPGGYEAAYLPACRVTRDGTGAITTVQFGSVQPGRIIII